MRDNIKKNKFNFIDINELKIILKKDENKFGNEKIECISLHPETEIVL